MNADGTLPSRISDKEAFVLSLFVLGEEHRKVGDIPWALRARYDVSVSVRLADQICKLLENKGLLDCTLNPANIGLRQYALCRSPSIAVVRQIIKLLRELGFMSRSSNGGMRMLAALLDGGRDFDFANDSPSYYYNRNKSDDLWFAVTRFASIVGNTSIPQLSFQWNIPDAVYRTLASVFFLPRHGRDADSGGMARQTHERIRSKRIMLRDRVRRSVFLDRADGLPQSIEGVH